jgi:DNA-binding transcriptional ArsR family regulator
MEHEFGKFEKAANYLKALAHPVRLQIVNVLLEKSRCNVGTLQETLVLPQSTVSQHLQKLRLLGIVSTERIGLEVNYTVIDHRVNHFFDVIFAEPTK